MNHYPYNYWVVYDEYGQAMRVVKTSDEAKHLIKTYKDWTAKFVKVEKQKLDLPDAPF